MTWLTWVLLLGYVGLSAALYKLFPKAGKSANQALIPIKNMMVVAELVGRKPWHALLLLIPYFNVFIFAALMVDLCRSFGRFNFGEHVLSVIASWGYFGWMGNRDDSKYEGPILVKERAFRNDLAVAEKTGDKREINKVYGAYRDFEKPFYREWAEAAVFAIFAAAMIRLLLIESYIIPTPSMEGNLNVGDFLFVSKVHYGLRLPETILMIPLAHNRAPFIGGESYIEGAELPYRRLPALEAVDRYDPVVFNVPAGDSVYITPGRNHYPFELRAGGMIPQRTERAITNGFYKLTTRPRDKRDHYVKRAVGLPGERLEIKDRQVIINGEPVADPENIQFSYIVSPAPAEISDKWSDWGISAEDYYQDREGNMTFFLNDDQIEKMKVENPSISITHTDKTSEGGVRMYPHDTRYYGNWSVDNYGPITLPAKGMTIKLDDATHRLYWRAISVYDENPSYETKGGKYYLNGKEITEYTFKQDYYWMMGDNRHNSEDSRIWGFVPEDHILGKPLFVWFSIKEGSIGKGINWHRVGRNASKQGGR
ncbi:MAG: signal peptidase I [Neolewinella sp.]|jgi:signal peptidase I